MPFSKFTTFLFLVAFVLFIQNVLVVSDYDCLSAINFISNDYYETSLNDVMDYLTYETPGLSSRGHGLGRTYGRAICAGDALLSVSDCTSCLSNATNKIPTLWPYRKATVLWHDL
jgi:hypothetical protein